MARPRPHISNFAPIDEEQVVLAFLYGAGREEIGAIDLVARLGAVAGDIDYRGALQKLRDRGAVTEKGGLALTRKGVFAARSAFGHEGQGRWPYIRSRLLPLLPLGLTPSDPMVQRRFGRAEHLRAAILRVSFGLSCPPGANLEAICSELLWSTLESALAPLVRPQRPAQVFGPTERAILASLSKTEGQGSFHETVDGLCATALGLKAPASLAMLRDRLIQIGLSRAQAGRADLTRTK